MHSGGERLSGYWEASGAAGRKEKAEGLVEAVLSDCPAGPL